MCIYLDIIKLIRIKRQFKSTLNIIRLQYSIIVLSVRHLPSFPRIINRSFFLLYLRLQGNYLRGNVTDTAASRHLDGQTNIRKTHVGNSTAYVVGLFVCLFVLLYFFCLFVWGFSSHSRIFHSFGDVTIVGGGLQLLTYDQHSWPFTVTLGIHL